MHDTETKTKDKPLEEWSLDELIGEHDRLERRYTRCPLRQADTRDVLWMIEVACVLEEKGIILDKYYKAPVES